MKGLNSFGFFYEQINSLKPRGINFAAYRQISLSSTNGFSTDTSDFRPSVGHRSSISAAHRHPGLPRISLSVNFLRPPRLLPTPPLVGARRSELLGSSPQPIRSLFPDPQELFIFPCQLYHSLDPCSRFFSPLPSVLSLDSSCPPRGLEFSLHFPSFRSAFGYSRPYFFRFRDVGRVGGSDCDCCVSH